MPFFQNLVRVNSPLRGRCDPYPDYSFTRVMPCSVLSIPIMAISSHVYFFAGSFNFSLVMGHFRTRALQFPTKSISVLGFCRSLHGFCHSLPGSSSPLGFGQFSPGKDNPPTGIDRPCPGKEYQVPHSRWRGSAGGSETCVWANVACPGGSRAHAGGWPGSRSLTRHAARLDVIAGRATGREDCRGTADRQERVSTLRR